MKKFKKNDLRLEKEVISALTENDLRGVRGGNGTDIVISAGCRPTIFNCTTDSPVNCPVTMYNCSTALSHAIPCETANRISCMLTQCICPAESVDGCLKPVTDLVSGCVIQV